MTERVRVVTVVMLTIFLVVACICSMSYAINLGNVKVAESCVKSGGEWTLVKQTGNGSTWVDRACVRK